VFRQTCKDAYIGGEKEGNKSCFLTSLKGDKMTSYHAL